MFFNKKIQLLIRFMRLIRIIKLIMSPDIDTLEKLI